MSKAFTKEMQRFYDSEAGAFSVVTPTEFKDSQVTVTGVEKHLFDSFFGDRIKNRKGSVKYLDSKGISPQESFKRHPTGEVIELNLVYKTPTSTELRLYLRSGIFKPVPGDYWCSFIKGGELWLASMSEKFFRILHSGKFSFDLQSRRNEMLEPENDNFQELVNVMVGTKKTSTVKKWGRNPLIAAKAIEVQNFRCELYPNYPNFISRATGNPFMEAHHFIPMKIQDSIGKSLDIVENICSLNPITHRKLHHANFNEIKSDLDCLAKSREKMLTHFEISIDDVYELYA